MAITEFTANTLIESAEVNANFNSTLKYIGADQVDGSIASSTNETKIGEVAIALNTVNTSVLIIASGRSSVKRQSGSNATTTSTIKLYGGTDQSTPTNNTLYKTIYRSIENAYNGAGSTPNNVTDRIVVGWTIVYLVNNLTWSSTNYAQITGTNGVSSADDITACESIEVVYL